MSRIIIDADTKERWTGPLLEYYAANKNMDPEEAMSKIAEVFQQVEKGWNHAPSDIDTRIQMKTGLAWKSHGNLVPIRGKGKEGKIEIDEKNEVASYVYQYLSTKEKEWWAKRIIEYSKDFEFNDSSDKPLLTQLLVEEILQRRLFIKQLKEKDLNLSKEIESSLKRVTDIQVKLGITREQRSGALDNIDGNVADLSLSLNKKLKNMPIEMKAQYDDELRYETLKRQNPPVNQLPPKETMLAIVKKDSRKEGVEVTNKAASAITELVANTAKERSAKKELPIGKVL